MKEQQQKSAAEQQQQKQQPAGAASAVVEHLYSQLPLSECICHLDYANGGDDDARVGEHIWEITTTLTLNWKWAFKWAPVLSFSN